MAKRQELSKHDEAGRLDLFLLAKWKELAAASVDTGDGHDPGTEWIPVREYEPLITTPYSEIVARNLHFVRQYFLQASEGNSLSSVAPHDGVAALGSCGPDLTDDPRHRTCDYCICRCVNEDDFCQHCRFYMGSTPRRCYGKLKLRCGSIGYLLRHRFHREKRADEGLILRVAAAFKKTPMLVPSKGGRSPSTSAILAQMTPRQKWTYQIMTGAHGCGDKVYSEGNGRLTSIYDAANGSAILRQTEKTVPPSGFESDRRKIAGRMWLESCVDPFVNEI